MIPLRDTIKSYSTPIVNLSLIGVVTLVFLFEITLPASRFTALILNFGIVPSGLHLDAPLSLLGDPAPLITLFTHMFLHGGWFHFLSNVWILYIFGDNVEDRMGSLRYLFFYLSGGLISGLLQAIVTPGSSIPAIGASGAIAAVLGAYIVFYPGARIVTLIPIFLFPWFVNIPAIFYLGFWFISQLFSGLSALSLSASHGMGGVAWWAHIGGFLFGMLFYRLYTPPVHPAYTRRFLDDQLQ